MQNANAGTDCAGYTPAPCRMLMQMIGSFAEYERSMIRERTRAGLLAARAQGRIGGRELKLKPHQQDEAIRIVMKSVKTAADVTRLFGVHPATICRLLASARYASTNTSTN